MYTKMKALWIAVVPLVLSFASVPVRGAVIAEWEFLNQASLFDDSSGNGNTLTGGSGITVSSENYSPDGGTVTSAYFNGSQQWLRVSNLGLSVYDALKFEWSMQAAGDASSTVNQRIMQSNYDHNVIGGLLVYINRSAGELRVSHRVGGGWGQATFSVPTLDEWHEYELIINNNDSTAGGHILLSVDGEVQAATVSTYNGSISGTFLDTQFYIGSNANSAGVSATALNRFVGYLQDVRITSIPEASSIAWGLVSFPVVLLLRRRRLAGV